MFRRVLLGVLLTFASFVVASASANAFNPATQSHWGACARETDRVALAVRDYAANGVAVDFARLVGLHGSGAAAARQLRRSLVVGSVESGVVTQNHGCDGTGDWFAVGPRALERGEQVGVRLSQALRRRACVRSHLGCRPITVDAHVVFPTNCWNPNMGAVRVVVYVHRRHPPRPKPKPKRKPKPRNEVAAFQPQTVPPSVPSTAVEATTVRPQATAALDCASAAVNVTISNAAGATAAASFDVQGAAYGPLAPGASETIALPLKPGEKLTLTVTSGPATLIAGEQIVNECRAEPIAAAKFVGCLEPEVSQGFGMKVAVTLADGSGATLPSAPFTVEWDAPRPNGEREPIHKTETLGPLAPGESKTLSLVLEAFESLPTVTVTSGGEQILKQPISGRQCVGG